MFGPLISPHAFLELFYKSTAGLHSFVTEIVNICLAKLLLGSQCILQEIQRLDTYGEKLLNQLGIFLMTKWKLVLLLMAIVFCIFKLLQKTRKLNIGFKYIVMFRNCVSGGILQALGKQKLENLPCYFSHLSCYSQSF